MTRKAMWLGALLALAAGMGSDWSRTTVRPRLLPGIPKADYKVIEPSATPAGLPVTASSFKAVDTLSADGKVVTLRTFAMDQSALKNLHCSIAQVVLTITREGTWTLNGKADQNPWFTTQPNALPPVKLAGILKIDTNYLLRNEFLVKVRCYGNSPLKETIKTVGKPVLAEIELKKFWVERGVPLQFKQAAENANSDLAKNFAIIDRVEYELSFR